MERFLIKTSTPISTSRSSAPLWQSADISRSKSVVSQRRSSINATPRAHPYSRRSSAGKAKNLQKKMDISQRHSISLRDERLMLILNSSKTKTAADTADTSTTSSNNNASTTPISAKFNHVRDVANRENVPPRSQNLMPQSTSSSAVKMTKDLETNMHCTPPAKVVGDVHPALKHNPMIMARLQRDLQSPSACTRVRAMKALKSPSKYENYFHFDVPAEEQDIITEEERRPIKLPTVQEIMKELVVYVEFRSEEDNRSAGIKKVISQMGATVNDKLLRTTTHVIFKDGLASTYAKAKSLNIPIVNILWIEACKRQLRIVNPNDYPIANKDVYENPELHKKIKRHKSMQPGAIDNIKVRKQKLKPDDLVSSPALEFNFCKKPTDNFREILKQYQQMPIPEGIDYDTPKRMVNLDLNCNSPAPDENITENAMKSQQKLLHLDTVSDLGDSANSNIELEKEDDQKTASSSTGDATVIPNKTSATPTRRSRRLSFQACELENSPVPNQSAQTNVKNLDSNEAPRNALNASIYSTPSQRNRRLSKTWGTGENTDEKIVAPPTTPSTLRRSNRRSLASGETSIPVESKTPTRSVARRRTLFTPSFATSIPEENSDYIKQITMDIDVAKSSTMSRNGTRSALKRRTIFGTSPMELTINLTCEQTLKSPVANICKKLTFNSTITEEEEENAKIISSQDDEVIPCSQMTPNVTKRRRTIGKKVSLKNEVTNKEAVIYNSDLTKISVVSENLNGTKMEKSIGASVKDIKSSAKTVGRRETFHFTGTGTTSKLHETNSSPAKKTTSVKKQNKRSTIVHTTPIKRLVKNTVNSITQSSACFEFDFAKIGPTSLIESATEKPKESSQSKASEQISTTQKRRTINALPSKSLELAKPTKTPVNDRRRTMYEVFDQKIQEMNRLNKLNDSVHTTAPSDLEKPNVVECDKTLTPCDSVTSTSQQAAHETSMQLVTNDSQKQPSPPPAQQLFEKTENNETDLDEAAFTTAVTKKRKLFPPTALYNQMFGSTPPQLLKAVSKTTEKKKRDIDEEDTGFHELGATKKKVKTSALSRRSTMDFQAKSMSTLGCINEELTVMKKPQQLPFMVVTSLGPAEIDCVKEAISLLGGFEFSDQVDLNTTHVVCGEPRRTINMLRAIARGLWILEITWVVDSMKAKKWLFEDTYEMRHFSDSIEMCRVERQAVGSLYRSRLFAGFGPIYISSKCSIPSSNLIELTQLCGGKVTSNRSKANAIIGNYAKKDVQAICVHPNWILDSITYHKLQKIKKYQVKPLLD